MHCIGSLGGGGAERQLAYLSLELVKKGIDVHVAYLHSGANLIRVRDSGATLHELRSRSNYDPILLWRLVDLVRGLKPDLIHTWLPQMDVLAGLAAWLTRTPFLMTERSAALAYDGGWKEHLRRAIGRRAALIVANSHSGREYWLPQKPSGQVAVIRNGMPIEDIQRALPIGCGIRGVCEETEIVLFAGRYSPEKNLWALLDALFLVLSKRRNAVALFFGQGPLKTRLIAKVKRHGMEDRVRILDYTAQLWGWMKRASLFVSVSLFEGSPNTVLEAAAQGCTLVVSDIPQHRELLAYDAAFFVSPSSPEDIARGIFEALNDPGTAGRKAQFAREMASRLTLDSIGDRYLDAYRLTLAAASCADGSAGECARKPSA